MPRGYNENFPLIWTSEMHFCGMEIPLVASYLWGRVKTAYKGLPVDVKVEVVPLHGMELSDFTDSLFQEKYRKFCVLTCVPGAVDRETKPKEEKRFGRAIKALLKTGGAAYEVIGLDGYTIHLFLKTKKLTRILEQIVSHGYRVNDKLNYMLMIVYKN